MSLLWLLALVPLAALILLRAPKRPQTIPPSSERVLILGASSGIGRAIALHYAARRARVCIVARRADKLVAVAAECAADVLHVSADFADPDALLRVRALVEAEWGGLDTLIVNAGVSALQPLLAIARPDPDDRAGLVRVHDVAAAALRGNFTGPLLSAVTFIPFLTRTSPAPAVLLVSSVAALIPAPTRTLYAASKAAALILFQALSIEHPAVRFTAVIPATVEGDFRASAVDAGPVREDLGKSLKREYVARECVRAVDAGLRTLWLPAPFRFAHLLYWIFPVLVDVMARRKYNFYPT